MYGFSSLILKIGDTCEVYCPDDLKYIKPNALISFDVALRVLQYDRKYNQYCGDSITMLEPATGKSWRPRFLGHDCTPRYGEPYAFTYDDTNLATKLDWQYLVADEEGWQSRSLPTMIPPAILKQLIVDNEIKIQELDSYYLEKIRKTKVHFKKAKKTLSNLQERLLASKNEI